MQSNNGFSVFLKVADPWRDIEVSRGHGLALTCLAANSEVRSAPTGARFVDAPH